MRNLARFLAAALFCGALFSAAFVGAQEATETPAPPVDATTEVTAEPTMEVTSEPTMELTAEATAEMTTAPTTGSNSSSTQATTAPTTAATVVPTTSSSTGSTTTNANGMITCNSDLILNLYIAERYFGFAAVMDAATTANTTGTSAFVDLNTIDKGQFTPLFTNLMSRMATNSMMMPGSMMTQDQIQSMGSMMNMDQTDMANQMATMMPPGTDMSSMTTLAIASLPDEPQECTMLRAELNRFYSVVAFNDMQTSMGTGAEATADANTSAGGSATGSNVNLGAQLAGANEVPGPGDPDGTGTAAVTVDMANSQVCYTLAVQNITLPAMAAHIHRGAAGVAGPVVVPLDLVPDASGNATSCVKADSALLNEIATNPAGFYVNVHTSDFPDGAERGQLSG